MNTDRMGMCTVCFEFTNLDDPCCPMAGVFINGEAVFLDYEATDSQIKAETIKQQKEEGSLLGEDLERKD